MKADSSGRALEDRQTLILGAGGMAREVYEIYKALGREDKVLGFCVTIDTGIRSLRGKRVFLPGELPPGIHATTACVGAIGSPLRRQWIETLIAQGAQFESIMHSSALTGTSVVIHSGVVVCAQCVLTCDITVGEHTIINVGSYLHHGCAVGAYATIGPGVKIGGDAEIGENVFIGIGATVSHRVKIGKNSIIGAGAVVVDNIPDSVLAYGIPARVIKPVNDQFIKDFL